MPDESNGDSPSADSENQPIPQSPVSPVTPEQNKMRENPEGCSGDKKHQPSELERDIRTGEICLITINGLLLVTTIVIACIYYGQLEQMRKATEANTSAANAAVASAEIARWSLIGAEESSAFTLSQMEAQSDAQQKSAKAAMTAAKATERQVDLINSFANRDLRPYVQAFEFGSADPIQWDAPFRPQVHIRNSGRTPAIKLVGCVDSVVESGPLTDTYPCPSLKNPKGIPSEEPNRKRGRFVYHNQTS